MDSPAAHLEAGGKGPQNRIDDVVCITPNGILSIRALHLAAVDVGRMLESCSMTVRVCSWCDDMTDGGGGSQQMRTEWEGDGDEPHGA